MKNTDKLTEFKNWLVDSGKSKNTVESYTNKTKNFLVKVGVDFDNVSHDILNNHLREIKRTKKGSSVLAEVYALKLFFKFCGVKVKIDFDRPKPNPKVRKIPTVQQVHKIIRNAKVCDPGFRGERNSLIIAMLYYTGIRIDELTRVKVSDINLHNKTLFIPTSKNGESRTIPISSDFYRKIILYLSHRSALGSDSPYLFLSNGKNRSHKKMSRGAIGHLIRKCFHEAGFFSFSPYCLRHLFATQLVHSGASLTLVSNLMGHKNGKSIFDYVIPKDISNEEIMEYL